MFYPILQLTERTIWRWPLHYRSHSLRLWKRSIKLSNWSYDDRLSRDWPPRAARYWPLHLETPRSSVPTSHYRRLRRLRPFCVTNESHHCENFRGQMKNVKIMVLTVNIWRPYRLPLQQKLVLPSIDGYVYRILSLTNCYSVNKSIRCSSL